MKNAILKSVDAVAYSLLLIGARNWGLIGFFDLDLIAALCGSMTLLTRSVYGIVGLAALYDLMTLPSIFRRWEIHLRYHPVHI